VSSLPALGIGKPIVQSVAVTDTLEKMSVTNPSAPVFLSALRHQAGRFFVAEIPFFPYHTPIMKPLTDPKKIEWFLGHAVENVYPSREEVAKKLASGERLTVYLGIDPTGPTLHLGHLITMQKLAELQAMGHKIILLIGDFTAMIGDPTDKLATRKQLTRDEVLSNCELYKEQASRLLKFGGDNPAEFKFNSKWLAKMSLEDAVELASHFTVQQMMERDMFEKRVEEGKPIHLHEFLYPLMQGYDSVAMDVDMEVGGNDQTFNMLAGRTLMKAMKGKEKFVLTTTLLADPTGKKMGKSEGNMIALTDAPEDMYGKVMSWTDEMIVPGFEICTDASKEEVLSIKKAMEKGENPMAFKRDLAKRIVAWLIGAEAAEGAEGHFAKVHQEGSRPEEVAEVSVDVAELSLVDALVEGGLVSSKSDARRQIEQGGVKVNDKVVNDPKAMVIVTKEGTVIQKGKRHFVKLVQR
jgi:tyrosyl-tRNA synthetase